MVHKLPDLSYSYDALEPYIDQLTMKIHHTKHHAGYVNNLNDAIKEYNELKGLSLEELLGDTSKIPETIRQAVINNAGGHANHSLYWKIMHAPEKNSQPEGKLNEAIKNTFGGTDTLIEKFNEKAMSVFGSGWAFLVVTKSGKLELTRQSFQNSPLMNGQTPILGIDVWEHAYYLKYQNRRSEYVGNFRKLINWSKVSSLYNSSLE